MERMACLLQQAWASMKDFREFYPLHRDLEDGRTLVYMELALGRGRVAFADQWGIGEHW
jgi:hypothetical protein